MQETSNVRKREICQFVGYFNIIHLFMHENSLFMKHNFTYSIINKPYILV